MQTWREAYQKGQSPGSAACPDEERLAALVLGELDGVERDRCADHVVACRRCTALYRDLAELHDAAGETLDARATSRPAPVSAFPAWAWRAAAAAAVVVVGVALSLVVLRDREPGPVAPSELRGGDTGAVALEPTDGAVLASPPERFAFPPAPGADGYQVILQDLQARTLWESDVSKETSVAVPEDVRASLRRGARYYWRIIVHDGPARIPSESRHFTVR